MLLAVSRNWQRVHRNCPDTASHVNTAAPSTHHCYPSEKRNLRPDSLAKLRQLRQFKGPLMFRGAVVRAMGFHRQSLPLGSSCRAKAQTEDHVNFVNSCVGDRATQCYPRAIADLTCRSDSLRVSESTFLSCRLMDEYHSSAALYPR